MWQGLMELDRNILFYVQDNLRNDTLNDIVVWFTSLGNAGLILCFIVVNLFLKNAVARVRPYDAMEQIRCLVEPQADYSFPSGHTAVAFAASVPVFIISSKKLGIIMIIFSVLMAFSRIYVCVHYPTDVIGGAVIGILCGVVTGMVIYPKLYSINNKRDTLS